MQVIKDVKHFKVVCGSMRLLMVQASALVEVVLGQEKRLFDLLFENLKSHNRTVKSVANETTVQVCQAISARLSDHIKFTPKEGLNDRPSESLMQINPPDIINDLLFRLKYALQKESDLTVIIACLQSYGALAKSINAAFGQPRIRECLYFLIENSEAKLFETLDCFENFDYEKNPQNFKAILFNQKQLIGLFRSLSFLLAEATDLGNKEVRYIQDLIELGIRYLPNFFPPYVSSLHENFSAFLNSIPPINYKKFIFRKFGRALLFAMDRSSQPFESSHQESFVRFFYKVVTKRVLVDSQLVIMEEFLKTLHELLSDKEVKKVSCDNPEFLKYHKETRDALNAILLFKGLVSTPKTAELLDTLSDKMIDTFWLIESKFRGNKHNFLYLQGMSVILALPTVQKKIKGKKELLARLEQLLKSLESVKEYYPGAFGLCVQEFSIRCMKIAVSETISDAFCANFSAFLQRENMLPVLLSEGLDGLKAVLELHQNKPVASLTTAYLREVFSRLAKIMSGSSSGAKNSALEGEKTAMKSGKISALQITKYLREGVKEPTEKVISDKIMNLIKNCEIDFGPTKNDRVIRIVAERPSSVGGRYQLDDYKVSLPVNSMLIYLIESLLSKRCPIEESKAFELSLSCAKMIYNQGAQGTAVQTDDKMHTHNVKRLIHLLVILLSKSIKDGGSGAEEVITILKVLMTELLRNPQNTTLAFTDLLDVAKKLYLAELQNTKYNNSLFLNEVAGLLSESLKTVQSQQTFAIDHLFEHLRIWQGKQNESLQLFQATLFELLVTKLRTDIVKQSTANKVVEILLEILQTVRLADGANTKVVAQLLERLSKIVRLLEEVFTVNSQLSLTSSEDFYDRNLTWLLENTAEQITVSKSCILSQLMSIAPLRAKMSAFLEGKAIDDLIHEENNRFMPVFYALFHHKQQTVNSDSRLRYAQAIDWLATNNLLLTYVLAQIEANDHKPIVDLLTAGKLTLELFLPVFDPEFESNELLFLRTIDLLIEINKTQSFLLEKLAEALLSQPLFTNTERVVPTLSLSNFKVRLSRVKIFFRRSLLTPALPPQVEESLNRFIRVTLSTRDELSIDMQMCQSIVTFLIFFRSKIMVETLVLDKSKALTNKLVKCLAKPSINDQYFPLRMTQIAQLLDDAFREQAIKQLEVFFRAVLRNEPLALGDRRINLKLEFLESKRALPDVLLSDLFELALALYRCGFFLDSNAFQVLLQLLKRGILGKSLPGFAPFKLANTVPETAFLVNEFLRKEQELIRSSIVDFYMFDTAAITISTQTYKIGHDIITNVVQFATDSGSLEWLRALDTAIANWNSKFVLVVDSAFENLIIGEKHMTSFLTFLERFLNDLRDGANQEQIDVNPEYWLMVYQNLISKVVKAFDKGCWVKVLKHLGSRLTRTISESKVTLKQLPATQASFTITIQTFMISAMLLRKGLQECTKEALINDVFPALFAFPESGPKQGTEITKRLVSETQELLQTIKELSASQSQLPHIVLHDSYKGSQNYTEYLITAYAAEIYNLLAVVSMKTQRNHELLLRLLLCDQTEEGEPVSLVAQPAFVERQNFEFQALTNYQTIVIKLTSYDVHEHSKVTEVGESFQSDKILNQSSEYVFRGAREPETPNRSLSRSPSPSDVCRPRKSPLLANIERLRRESSENMEHGLFPFRPAVDPLNQHQQSRQTVDPESSFLRQDSKDAFWEIEGDVVNNHRTMTKLYELFNILTKQPSSLLLLTKALKSILDQKTLRLPIRLHFLKLVLAFRTAFLPHSVT